MATAAAAARVLPHSSNVSHIFSMINEVLPCVVRGDPLLLLFKTEEELVSKVLGFGKSNTPTELCLYPPTQLMNYATVGSDNGWLLIAHPDYAFATSPSPSKYKYKYKYSLYNPITSVIVQLPQPPPPLPPRGGTVCRFVTSTTPTDPQCLIFAYICYNNPDNVMTELNVLAYCKPGDESWHVIQTTTTPNHDMIFHEGELYTVDFDGVLSVFRKDKMKVLKTQNFKTTDLITNGNWFKSSCYYLVKDQSGEILMVERAVRILGRRLNVLTETLSFRILKLKRRWWNKAAATKWEEVSTFGNAHQALFLQRGDSMFVSTIENTNYKPNCIYFMDDFSEDDPLNHVRVYDLKSRTIQPVNYDSSGSSIGVRADFMCRWFKASSI